LFAVALALRLVHVATLRHSPFFDTLLLDCKMYDAWGRRIAAGQWLGGEPFFQDPLYAYFLGALYSALGQRMLAVLLVQALLGALVAPLLFLAARRWLSSSTATIAGAVAAVYLPSIYYDGLILKTGLALFLVATLLWQLSRAAAGSGAGGWAAVGIVLGLATLTRGNLLLFAPLLAGWILLAPAPPGAAPASPRRRALRLAAYAAGLLAVLGGSALHNRLAAGEWILTTANAGQNLYIGNNPWNESGEYQKLPFVDANPLHERQDFAREAARRSGRTLGPREVSRFWRDRALAWIREDPRGFLRLTWRKLRVYWGAYEVPDSLDYALYRRYAPLLRLPLPGFGLVAPLGLLGALLALRLRGWPRLLVAFVVGYSASVVLFFVFSRFRMAMMPALFVLAGLAVTELAALARRARREPRARGRLLLAATALVAFGAFVNLPVRGAADGWSYRLAAAVGLPRRAESGALAWYNLGLAYAARAEPGPEQAHWLAEAEAALSRALELEPQEVSFHVELGKVLARQHRNDEAIERYRAAERLAPNDYRIAHSLGLLYRRRGELSLAEGAFRRSLELAPAHASGAVQLGEVLLEQGRPREAAAAFRQALALRPGDRRAQEGLARAAARAPVSGP